MRFSRFLICQTLLFSFLFSMGYMLGNTAETGALIALNTLTFIPASWIITIWLRRESHLLMNVLSVTLSFNLVTYLMQIALGVPWPAISKLVPDFFLVVVLTLTGIYLGTRWPKQEES